MRGGATRRAEDEEEATLANRQRRKLGWTREEVAVRTTRKKGSGSHISTNYVSRGLNSRPYNSDAMLEWSH
jgi:transposase